MTVTCGVCNSHESKYKCSICFLPYCSVSCYGSHKNTENCTRSEKPTSDDQSQEEAQRYFSDDMIPPEKLKTLGESDKLKNLLKNTDLQKLITAVDSADNTAEAMSKAMKDPMFMEFADECLKLVEDTNS